MADKRMLTNTIISSAKFIKMPLETQALYMHLNLTADDEGIAEAFITMRMIGSSEDSLKILAAKGFIEILNEDLVIYITDWEKHNSIRPDRKKESVYKELLNRKEQGKPEIKLIEREETVTVESLPPAVKQDTKNVFKFYQENFGLITQFISQEIESFLDDGVEEDLIIKCLTIALEKNINNWAYAKSILNNKLKLNIKTLEQFEANEVNYKKSKVVEDEKSDLDKMFERIEEKRAKGIPSFWDKTE